MTISEGEDTFFQTLLSTSVWLQENCTSIIIGACHYISSPIHFVSKAFRDLGFFDPNGFLNFAGGNLPIAKIKDQMVDLIEIDNLLHSHPSVIRAVTVFKKGNKTIKKTLFTHLIMDNPEITPGQIKRFCAVHCPGIKYPLNSISPV